MTGIDRVILATIAIALVVIALNPWLAPAISQAQSGVMRVDIVGVAGKSLIRTYQDGTLPVEIIGSVSVQK